MKACQNDQLTLILKMYPKLPKFPHLWSAEAVNP